ncbi:major facilitator superfamily domain-containing protein [Xylogone sp. PMI_703]|nr:major facilitator superfamily domain-containing protein [Xylogone sp. PMI_703]
MERQTVPESEPVKEKEQQNNSEERDNSSGPVRVIRDFKWFLVCLSLYISALVYGLDTTIAADLCSPSAYYLHQFNMKWIYISSFVLFEVVSTVCGAAHNMDAIIVGRVIAGAGGAGLFLGFLNYFGSMTVPPERGLYIASIGLCWGAGTVSGPIIGGSFSISSATWRWTFYINLVIAAVTAPNQSLRQRLVKLDYVGFVLSAGMWVSFAMVTTMAGGQWPWDDSRTIALWVVFGVLLIGYILQQWLCVFTTTESRSFPVHLLKSRTRVLLGVETAANVAVCFCTIYFIPLYFQFVHGDGALLAAFRLLPFIAFNISTNLTVGHFLPRIQYYMPMYICSGVLATLASGLLMGYLKSSTSQSVIYGILVLLGFSTSMSFSMGYSISTLKVKPSDIGNVICFQDVCQLGSSTIILVTAGQVFQSRAIANLQHALANKGFSSADIKGAIAGAQSTLFKELSGDLKIEATNAITKAMQRTFVLAIVGELL